MNSPECVTNKDQCEFVGNDCCFQGQGIPCGLQGDMSILTGGGIGEPFCDDFYTEYYGYVEEMRLYCGNMNRQFVEGLTTRYGPKPGLNLFAWSSLHGGSQQDSQD